MTKLDYLTKHNIVIQKIKKDEAKEADQKLIFPDGTEYWSKKGSIRDVYAIKRDKDNESAF